MKVAKIILIILWVIDIIVHLAQDIKRDLPEDRVQGMLATIIACGIKGYLYYLVGIFNL